MLSVGAQVVEAHHVPNSVLLISLLLVVAARLSVVVVFDGSWTAIEAHGEQTVGRCVGGLPPAVWRADQAVCARGQSEFRAAHLC